MPPGLFVGSQMKERKKERKIEKKENITNMKQQTNIQKKTNINVKQTQTNTGPYGSFQSHSYLNDNYHGPLVDLANDFSKFIDLIVSTLDLEAGMCFCVDILTL